MVSSTNGELNVDEPTGAPSNTQIAARAEVEVAEEAKYVCASRFFLKSSVCGICLVFPMSVAYIHNLPLNPSFLHDDHSDAGGGTAFFTCSA